MQKDILPSHVGIIMDGNGRWAKARGKNRSYGHKFGAANVDKIVSHAFARGVKSLTLYAFSAENWLRPKEEVDELMRLIKIYLNKFITKLIKNQVRFNVIGDKSKLSTDLQKLIERNTVKSAGFTERTLNIAINYGGRQEIVNAVNTLIAEGQEITIESISSHLYTALSGEPDLIIRTGGEKRISNFLIFQGAYSELYFTEVMWPDFDETEFDKALEDFALRNRRFGGV